MRKNVLDETKAEKAGIIPLVYARTMNLYSMSYFRFGYDFAKPLIVSIRLGFDGGEIKFRQEEVLCQKAE